MFKKLQNLLSNFFSDQRKARLLDNFFSLAVLQGANYILPLLTIPYLVRVLGVEQFGLLMFAQSFITYINILTDYGFNLSATKLIAINREDNDKISEIFSGVFLIKLTLLLFCFIILFLAVFSFEKFFQDFKVYFFYFGIVVGNVLFPVWLFQGIEKMRYITILNIISKIIFTGLIFIFVKSPEDYLLAPLFQSLGYIVVGLISLIIIFKVLKLKFFLPPIKTLKGYFADSTQYFFSRVSVSVYTNTNTFMIGMILGNSFVGYYSSAEKIFNALTSLYRPLNDALYPYMSKNKDIPLFKKIFWIAFFFNTLLCLIIGIGSDFLTSLLYGEGFEITADLLKIFAIVSFLMVPAILLGYPLLGALGFPKYANYSVIVASVLHLIFLFLLIPIMNIYMVTVLLIISQLVVLGVRAYGVKKNIIDRSENK